METPPQSQAALDGLGNHVYLEKQDKLRDIGIDIDTSQIVVVGGQSSGKSSLLESLTGFSFPRGQGLCTRYATQISLRRNPIASTVISITPGPNCKPKRKEKVRGFRHEISKFQGETLASIMEEASEVMGIRSAKAGGKSNLPMFSSDILKIEISGPEEPHLTVIDVPGLFQVTEEGRTTENDRLMVETLARGYMNNERTIILAVMSCLADRATEGVLQLAKAADPQGKRTVGVLTKADLVREQAVYQTILELVRGKSPQLGYFVVRNRGADQDGLTLAQCKEDEKALFQKPQWAAIVKEGRTGVDALRDELQRLLTDLAKQELPKQRAEITRRLSSTRKALDDLGAPRDTAASQREHLIKVASKFERAAHDALEGRYDINPIFDDDSSVKLATRIVTLSDGFASLMMKKGHTRKFQGEGLADKWVNSADRKAASQYDADAAQVYATVSDFPELMDVLPVHGFECPGPSNDDIMEHIASAYNENRGPELGTFNSALLVATFREQAKMWGSIVHTHLGVAILTVHRFMKRLLKLVVDEVRVREEIWDALFVDKLLRAYKMALEHAKFVINIEMNSRPGTSNNTFNADLCEARAKRLLAGMQSIATDHDQLSISIRTDQVIHLTDSKANADHVKDDVHDILKSYYKVSLKRFVDAVNRQVIDYFLLSGAGNPLQILTPALITQLSDSQLEDIAGENSTTKRERQRLESEIQGLATAMKVLRG